MKILSIASFHINFKITILLITIRKNMQSNTLKRQILNNSSCVTLNTNDLSVLSQPISSQMLLRTSSNGGIGVGGGVGPGFYGVGAGTRGVGLYGGYGGPLRY